MADCRPHPRPRRETDFGEVDPRLLYESDWQLVFRGARARRENILRLEARSVLWVARHIARQLSGRRLRHLILCDNQPAVYAFGKWRAHSKHVYASVWSLAALSLALNASFCIRWVPSELNHSDSAS